MTQRLEYNFYHNLISFQHGGHLYWLRSTAFPLQNRFCKSFQKKLL